MGRRPRGQIIITHIYVCNDKNEIGIFPLDSSGRLTKDERFFKVLKKLNLRRSIQEQLENKLATSSLAEEIGLVDIYDTDYSLDDDIEQIVLEIDCIED